MIPSCTSYYSASLSLQAHLCYYYFMISRKNRNIILAITAIVLLIFAVIKLDILLRYDMSLEDYFKYGKTLSYEEEKLLNELPLNFGIYEDPPLAFTNEFNNYNSGIVSDYIAQLAIETRSNINMKVRKKEQLKQAFEDGEIDFTILESTENNLAFADLSIPMFSIKTKVIVPTASEIISLKDLEGKILVVLASDNQNREINSLFSESAGIEFMEVNNMYQCFALMRNNTVAGYVGDDLQIAHYLNVTSKGNSYRFLKPVLQEKKMALAVPKDKAYLLDILNKGILALKKKDLINQTQYKWLGDYRSTKLDWRLIAITGRVILGILIIIIALTIWNYVMTKRVNAKTRELMENKEELRQIIDAIKSGIMVIENDDIIVECNYAIGEILGISINNLLGKPYREVAPLQPFLDKAQASRLIAIGNSYYLTGQIAITNNKQMLIIEDYSEKYLSERKARQESKMIAVGRLSAGLAHEIRNPLGLIKSYNFVLRKYSLDDIGNHALRIIDNSVDSINTLIENLLRFSRLSNYEARATNVTKVIDGIVEIEKEKTDKNVNIYTTYFEGSDREVSVNEDVLKMVVQNLLENAIDSFEDDVDTNIITLETVIKDDELQIKISDNGSGIEKDIIESIFDPFYSTKETGTGLGLYIVSTEIENNNGSISVESTKGVGTTFRIKLPLLR